MYWDQLSSPNSKTCSPLWSLHQMIIYFSSDGIDKKLQNKKLELRQNIIENSTIHELKPCFK